MSRGVKKASIRDLSRYQLEPEDLGAWVVELTGSSPRACALVGGAFLANLLQRLICTKLIPLDATEVPRIFESPGPATDFHQRIELAWALGLIDGSTRGDLRIIKDVRNAFGHAPQRLTFADPFITSQCLNLTGAGLDVRSAFVERVLDLGGDWTHAINHHYRLANRRLKRPKRSRSV